MMDKNLFVVRDKIYSDIGDYLNTVRFKVKVPIYALEVPAVVKNKIFIPSFIADIDKSKIVLSVASISDMINFSHKSILFSLANEEDTLKIYKIIEEYILNVNQVRDLPEHVTKYMKKVNKFKILLQRTLDRLSNVNPIIEREYKKKDSIINILDDYKGNS